MAGVRWIARSLRRLVLSILDGEAEEQIFDDARRSDLPTVAESLAKFASRVADAPPPGAILPPRGARKPVKHPPLPRMPSQDRLVLMVVGIEVRAIRQYP